MNVLLFGLVISPVHICFSYALNLSGRRRTTFGLLPLLLATTNDIWLLISGLFIFLPWNKKSIKYDCKGVGIMCMEETFIPQVYDMEVKAIESLFPMKNQSFSFLFFHFLFYVLFFCFIQFCYCFFNFFSSIYGFHVCCFSFHVCTYNQNKKHLREKNFTF